MSTIQLKNKPQTVNDRQDRLEKISLFNKDSLQAMTVNELRELSSWLIPNLRKLKKNELIDKILEITESYRNDRAKKEEREKLRIDEALAYYITTENDKDFILELINSELSCLEIANIIFKRWKNPIGKKPSPKDSTIAKTKTKQLRIIIKAIELEKPELTEKCNNIYDAIKELVKNIDEKVNKTYTTETRANYGTSETIRTIYHEKVLTWCFDTISRIVNEKKLKRGEWYQLSFALSLTSGRRMDEIHGRATHNDQLVYKLIDDNQIYINELSKLSQPVSLVFTPLIDAKLWLDGFDLLPNNVKNLSNEVVNETISRNMSKSPSFQLVLKELGFTQKNQGYYKDARDFYICYTAQISYPLYKKQKCSQLDESLVMEDIDIESLSVFVKKMIGHTSKDTQMSYDKLLLI